ncbi:MAG: ferric reductase [Jatrophihabitans sp.]|nr:MAG: ferric reductase [Jatrophihabitans sp.]
MTLWLLTRTAGLTALVLLTATTCLGVLAAHSAPAGRRYLVQYVHRATAALGLGAVAVHVVTVVADSYAHVSAAGAVVPFTAGYRPFWVGLGTIAGYLLLAVAALGFARGRLAARPAWARAWRGAHGLGYLAWALAVVHGFAAGTDATVPWTQFVFLGCLAAVGAAAVARVAGPAVAR